MSVQVKVNSCCNVCLDGRGQCDTATLESSGQCVCVCLDSSDHFRSQHGGFILREVGLRTVGHGPGLFYSNIVTHTNSCTGGSSSIRTEGPLKTLALIAQHGLVYQRHLSGTLSLVDTPRVTSPHSFAPPFAVAGNSVRSSCQTGSKC